MLFKLLDFSILVIAIIFFIGVLAFDYSIFGFSEPLMLISDEWKLFFDVLLWPLVSLLLVDLTLKYKNTKNPKKFIKKYWIDILMLILIPVFSVSKSLKIGISIVKYIPRAGFGRLYDLDWNRTSDSILCISSGGYTSIWNVETQSKTETIRNDCRWLMSGCFATTERNINDGKFSYDINKRKILYFFKILYYISTTIAITLYVNNDIMLMF